jgi:deazaflavin-dependent oxidoreductase (nitroreductase family)
VLVLITSGRRSGKRRETPLTYVRDIDGSLLIAGAAVGQTSTPDWVANLRAEAACEAIVDKQVSSFVAVELAGKDREMGWRRIGEELPKLKRRMANYEVKARRTIPVFRLEYR